MLRVVAVLQCFSLYLRVRSANEEGLVRSLTITLTAISFALGTTALALTAHAQTQGAATIHAQAQNATPIHQVRVRRLGPLVPAWKPPRRQPDALLVRPLPITGTSPSRRCRKAASSGGLLLLHAASPITAHAAGFAASAGTGLIVALRQRRRPSAVAFR